MPAKRKRGGRKSRASSPRVKRPRVRRPKSIRAPKKREQRKRRRRFTKEDVISRGRFHVNAREDDNAYCMDGPPDYYYLKRLITKERPDYTRWAFSALLIFYDEDGEEVGRHWVSRPYNDDLDDAAEEFDSYLEYLMENERYEYDLVIAGTCVFGKVK